MCYAHRQSSFAGWHALSLRRAWFRGSMLSAPPSADGPAAQLPDWNKQIPFGFSSIPPWRGLLPRRAGFYH